MLNLPSILTDVFDRRAEVRLSLEDEREALAAAQGGDADATLRLVLAYAPALRNGVAAFTRATADGASRQDLDDVRSQAVLGLLEAIQAFDPERHERLAALAPGHIRNAVATEAAGVSSFTVPERTLKRFFGILRAADGNVYEAARIAPSMEMRAETFLAVLAAVRNVGSLDAALDAAAESGEDSWGFVDARPLWDGSEADADDRVLVETAFEAVGPLEADVTRLAFGFSDFDPVPDAEIGHRLGFSRAKVQRTRSSALTKMRSALGVA